MRRSYTGPYQENPKAKAVVAAGYGLQYRHLYAALRGDPGDSIRLLVDILHGAESHGPVFLEAHRAEVALLLQHFGEAVARVARATRRAH